MESFCFLKILLLAVSLLEWNAGTFTKNKDKETTKNRRHSWNSLKNIGRFLKRCYHRLLFLKDNIKIWPFFFSCTALKVITCPNSYCHINKEKILTFRSQNKNTKSENPFRLISSSLVLFVPNFKQVMYFIYSRL